MYKMFSSMFLSFSISIVLNNMSDGVPFDFEQGFDI
jgi:cytochrome bd-type quinol oxidase subunit 2